MKFSQFAICAIVAATAGAVDLQRKALGTNVVFNVNVNNGEDAVNHFHSVHGDGSKQATSSDD